MRELMCKPERKQLGVKAEALSVGISNGGKVLETSECDPTTVDDQLASVCRTDTHHEHDVDVDVLLEEQCAALFRGACQRDDVRTLEHLAEIGAVRERGAPYDVGEMRAFGVNDVVVPVRLEKMAVGFVVSLVCGDAVGAIENGEKIRQQVDQHSTGKRPARGDARTVTRTGAPARRRVGRGMIVATRWSNKRQSRGAQRLARFFPLNTAGMSDLGDGRRDGP